MCYPNCFGWLVYFRIYWYIKGVRKMTREEMLDNIIRKYGFEHSATITFATLMEDANFSEKMIVDLYRGLMDL